MSHLQTSPAKYRTCSNDDSQDSNGKVDINNDFKNICYCLYCATALCITLCSLYCMIGDYGLVIARVYNYCYSLNYIANFRLII
jgi:hypothetical protein